MNKYKLTPYTILVSFILLFTSCDDYLDELPDDRLELDTAEKAAKVVADSYSQGSYAFTDMYTDLAGPTGIENGGVVANAGGNFIDQNSLQLYTWEDVDGIAQDTPTYFWDRSYEAIAQTNEVLAAIDDLSGTTDFKNAIKGEALLSRAYSHFMLVNVFALHYDQNASTNLGIPYVLKPETRFLPDYERNTVEEVYDLVEKDLLEGLSLIDDQFFSGSKKYHFTKKAGFAFASRFYLWKKDYINCIKYSDLFFDGNPELYVKKYDELQGSTYNDIADKYNETTDDSNVLVMQKFSNHQRVGTGFRLNITDLGVLFNNPLNTFDERTSTGIWNVGTDARYTARLREYFFRENLSSNSGLPYHVSIELKGEEVLLNRAEAQLFAGAQNEALSDINVLARLRYNNQEYNDINQLITYYNATDGIDAIEQLILDERKKEFWDHGLRWFDIKRFNLSISHTLPENLGGETFELTTNDLRKAIQIPDSAIDFGITPNPR
ncbi:RagB/SusD family nutrient uptake outer membrane protein [uncultured Aquimarina sp.]|uniref:RagB/SusD family nutrient uptake outer membrane protein n=1 Tax=uncultured Aquimarina sp. TaxID=575652 RepID=UPI0026151AFD|nr:RagB/SusD family nutrient uptake outer membrane protein [uncultured Aquimarina sp.]